MGEHGRGGIGTVTRAHDKELCRQVAIKELISRGDINELRFLREAMITARLEHPGIVPVHEAGRWPDGTPFYVMKLVAGRSLKELLVERKTVEERLGLLHHVIAVTDAVAYAHRRKIIHRDLKPSNVIVGDFGETVVIDWGLAKDLAADEEPVGNEGVFRTAPVDDLTVTGSILGTPAYMAPEQARGESADQRADVFAIGAMLWQLCSLQRVPPSDAKHRRRVLRRARIDADFVTIIGKALHEVPSRRYRDAAELADDLRAFKSGSRISARRYTVPTLIWHWIRRHRAITVASLGVIAVSLLVSTQYLRGIASAHQRTREALTRVEVEATRADRVNAELTLENAALLLHNDPTAAAKKLASYHGDDKNRHDMLLAEAYGRGVASVTASPHTDTIWMLHPDHYGAIVSLAEDGTIKRTLNGTSTSIVNDVSSSMAFAISDNGQIAYARTPTGIGIVDVENSASVQTLPADGAQRLAISPDGTQIAALDMQGKLRAWQNLDPRQPLQPSLTEAELFAFADNDRLVVADKNTVTSISMSSARTKSVRVSGSAVFAARKDHVVSGNSKGIVTVWNATLDQIATAPVCSKAVRSIAISRGGQFVGFSCNDGSVGVIEIGSHSIRIKDQSIWRDEIIAAEPDESGRYLAIATNGRDLHVRDTKAHVSWTYSGHVGRISCVTPPHASDARLLVGDVNGNIRVWTIDAPPARAMTGADGAVYAIDTSPDNEQIVAGGDRDSIVLMSLDNGAVHQVKTTSRPVVGTVFSPDGLSF